ncbi:15698_t:CDS:2, partial [Funneliformis geosporum]
GDVAGQQATIKIALALLAADIECEIVNHSLSLDPDEICQQKQEELTPILQKKEDPYLYILQYFFQTWEIRENPQSIQNFIQRIAELFKNFSGKVQEFLIEKPAEVKEIYFAAQKKPASKNNDYNLTEINSLTKEKYLLAYCCQNRRCWLILQQENYTFSQPENRYLYQIIHNFYTAESCLEADFAKLNFSNNNKIELQEIINEINPNSLDDFLKLLQEKQPGMK